jgi:hypothetical protein
MSLHLEAAVSKILIFLMLTKLEQTWLNIPETALLAVANLEEPEIVQPPRIHNPPSPLTAANITMCQMAVPGHIVMATHTGDFTSFLGSLYYWAVALTVSSMSRVCSDLLAVIRGASKVQIVPNSQNPHLILIDNLFIQCLFGTALGWSSSADTSVLNYVSTQRTPPNVVLRTNLGERVVA